MGIQKKIIILFSGIFIIMVPVLYFSINNFSLQISKNHMKKQAQIMALMLRDGLINIDWKSTDTDRDKAEKLLRNVYNLAEEAKSFKIAKILLIDEDYKVDLSYPSQFQGEDYSKHADIRECFENKGFDIVYEEDINDEGEEEVEVDAVLHLAGKAKQSHVLEIKMNFNQSMILIKKQSQVIRLITISGFIFLMALLLVFIILSIRRSILQPLLIVSETMNKVGKGDLDAKLAIKSNDEFGRLSIEFNHMVKGLRENEHLSEYVSGSTKEAVRQKALGKKQVSLKKELVIFFSDIRGFTNYSEKTESSKVVHVLNQILAAQADIIRKHNGDIDKFIGDAAMAIFTDAKMAARAALEIIKDISINHTRYQELNVGIGIHKGPVIQGDIGAEGVRDFTVIGDTVNTASRIAAKAEGAEILISEDMATSLQGQGMTLTRKDSYQFKGKAKLMTIYSVTEDSK